MRPSASVRAEVQAVNQQKYADVQALAARYDVHPATIWRWVKAGRFPKPVQLSPGVTRWNSAEVEAFDAAREAARRTAA
jgi:prophage regulatory protein